MGRVSPWEGNFPISDNAHCQAKLLQQKEISGSEHCRQSHRVITEGTNKVETAVTVPSCKRAQKSMQSFQRPPQSRTV